MAIAVTSCTQEDALTSGNGEKTLHVSVESTEIASRVGFTDGEAKFFWTKDDVIGVTTTTATKSFQEMTFQGEGGQTSGNFTGSISGNPSGYAVYPSNSSHEMSGSTLTYSLPCTYSYTTLDGTYANVTGNSHNMPMWATIKDGAAAFKHLGGVAVIEINDLPANTSGLTFTFKANSKINGTFTVDLTVAEPILETSTDNVTESEKVVTITFSTAENQTKGYFYVPVPTGTYDWSVTVTDGEGGQKACGIWERKEVSRKDIYRLKIGESTIVGGEDNTKTVSSVNDITDEVWSTEEENLAVKVTGEVEGQENSIIIPASLRTETTTFTFASIASGATIKITDAAGGSYDGQIIIEVPESTATNQIEVNVPNGEVYIKQGDVTNLIASSKNETTIIGAGVEVGKLTVNKGNVKLEDGADVTTIERGDTNSDNVTYVIYEGEIPTGAESTDLIKHISATEWDLMKALATASSYTLQSDVVLKESLTIPNDKTFTLDLNGHTISQTKEQTGAYFMIQNNGELTIKDSATGGKISYIDSGGGGEYVSNTIQNNGTLTVESGTIENLSSQTVATNGYPHAIDNRKSLTIEGGEIKSSNYSSVRIWCTTDDDTSVNIAGGTFTGAVDLHNVDENANKGTLTIKGGTFNQNNYGTNVIRLVNFGANIDELSINLEAGIVNGGFGVAGGVKDVDLADVLTVTGGTFSETSVFKYLASNANVNVKLSADATIDSAETLTVPETSVVNLDLNGCDLSKTVSADVEASEIIKNNGTLNISNTASEEATISFVSNNPDTQEIPTYATNTITNEGTLTINENVKVTNGSDGGASYAVDDKGVFTLNGGALIGKVCALRVAKYNQDNVVFTMNSGLVQASTPAWIQLPGSDANVAPTITVEINGGTFETTKESSADNDVLYTRSWGNSHANTKITINGGKFLKGTVSIGAGYYGDVPSLTIGDGTFDYDVIQCLENDASQVVYSANNGSAE